MSRYGRRQNPIDFPGRASQAAALASALALVSCTSHVPVSRLVAQGQLAEACLALEHCHTGGNECPELRTHREAAARVSLLREALKRSGGSVSIGQLSREELAKRVDLQVPLDYAEKSVSLRLTLRSRDPRVRISVESFWLDGVPELFDGDEKLERYVVALGGPRRPAMDSDLPSSAIFGTGAFAFWAHFLTFGLLLPFELAAARLDPPLLPTNAYLDKRGRPIDHWTWRKLPEVVTLADLYGERGCRPLRVPPGGALTLTQGFTFVPWQAGDVGAHGYHFVWKSAPKIGWSQAVAVSPAGWVASMNRSGLTVHARESGRALAGGEVCNVVRDGLFLTAAERGIVVCDEGLGEVSFPKVEFRKTVPLPFRPEGAALGGVHLAVFEKGSRRAWIYRTDTWTSSEQVNAPFAITAVAVSADGTKIALGGEDGATLVRPIGGGAEVVIRPDRGTHSSAMSFSPDGLRLFTHGASFAAQEIDVTKGRVLGTYHAGSWLNASRHLSNDVVAASGSEGTVLYVLSSGARDNLHEPGKLSWYTQGLGASADGTLVCSGDRDGGLACYAKGPLRPAALFDAWQSKDRLVLRLELPAKQGSCAVSAPLLRLDLPPGRTLRDRIAGLTARGDIPLWQLLE